MWPFDKLKQQEQANKEQQERNDELEAKLEILLQEKLEREEAERKEQEEVEAAIAEANRLEQLAKEEQERKNAEKALATERGEPWVNVVNMEMDPEDNGNIGAIELDWNDHFVQMLHKNGYNGVSDEDAVDQWFRDVCKHVVLETYENEESGQRINRDDLGDGRAEYS